MTFFNKPLLIAGLVSITTFCYMPALSAGNGRNSKKTTLAVDFNEETHLVFMREEEKLARDVYITLGQLYKGVTVFDNIDDSEEQHTTTVRDKLAAYTIDDPSTSDEVGEFTGEDYGGYFMEKYAILVAWGKESLLDALHVGAYIEELDMLDIVNCPEVIIETHDSIEDSGDCGLNYTDNSDIQRMYEALYEGSKNHLRSYVGNIEAILGKCAYVPVFLDKETIESILGRTCE